MDNDKKSGFASMIVKDMEAPEGKSSTAIEPEVEVTDSEFAAKEFLDAVKSGDPKSVATAFKSLAACSGGEEDPVESDEADTDKPNPESE